MAKNETTQQPANEGQQAVETPQVLTAKTREDLFKQVEELKATLPEGKTLTAGAVSQNRDDGTFAIRIDII